MATFILIHGALHGGWCWETVVPLLEAAGHTVLAPDLPGMGRDPTPVDRVTLAMGAEAVADLVRAQTQPVILVGHSMGEITISETAERVPDRISTLVYVAALLLPSGMSVAERTKASAARQASSSSQGAATSFNPDLAYDFFYNRTDRAVAEKAIARLGAQPLAPMSTPLTLTAARFGRVPRAYIACTEDRAVSFADQRDMQATLPCDPVFTLETDHSPFLSMPKEFTACLLKIAAGAI